MSGEAAVRILPWGDPAVPAAARAVLAAGGIVAVPTESSYGLGVDPRDGRGVETIFRLKRRERGRALPVVAAEIRQLDDLAVDRSSPLLALARLWPAPLSLVLPTAREWPAGGGRADLAVRVPAHAPLRDLLREVGPLTATSANPSGETPWLEAAPVARWLEGAGEPALVIDGGRCAGGAPSTLVGLDAGGRAVVLREGAFPAERALREFSARSVENPVERRPHSAAGSEAERNA